MEIKHTTMYSKIGRSTHSKIMPLLNAIAQKPLKFKTIIIPYKILYSEDEYAQELELLKCKLLHRKNTRTVSLKEHSVASPKNKGTSSFLTFERHTVPITCTNLPDSLKYTTNYAALYSKPKFIIPWEKSAPRRDLFSFENAPSYSRKNCMIGKTASAMPSVNNTILLPKLLKTRSSSIHSISRDNVAICANFHNVQCPL